MKLDFKKRMNNPLANCDAPTVGNLALTEQQSLRRHSKKLKVQVESHLLLNGTLDSRVRTAENRTSVRVREAMLQRFSKVASVSFFAYAFACIAFLHGKQINAQTIDAASVYEKSAKAVVVIVAEKPGTAANLGSGAIISEDGMVVSALHVVLGADRVVIKLKNLDVYDHVLVAAFDARRDIIILKIPGFNLPRIPLGNSDEIREGDPLALISNPKGLEHTIAQGILSARRTFDELGFAVLQTSIPTSPGSSGGAILNAKGELVAVHSFKMVGGENLNFGIPVNYVRGLLDSSRGQANFSLRELSEQLISSPTRPSSEILKTRNSDISGEWLSLTSNTRRKIRVEGQYLYVERLLSKVAVTLGDFTLCELKLVEKRYQGICRTQFTIGWGETLSNGMREYNKPCRDTFEIEFSIWDPNRIEGRVRSRSMPIEKWSKKDVENCGDQIQKKWEDFVWIRPD